MKTLKTILQEVISGIKAWVDANTVHKSGNETINGVKTFPDGIVANVSVDSIAWETITDKPSSFTPVAHTHTKSDVTGLLNSNFIPSANNSYDLGSSSYQWNNLYAKNYYYNGVAWGLDKANTWTGNNTFSGQNIYTAVNYGNKLVLKNTGLDLSNGNSGLTDTYLHFIQWADNSNETYAMLQGFTKSANTTTVILNKYKTDANTSVTAELRLENSGTAKSFYSNYNGDTDLGTSRKKWKTLNGINPGALSLPGKAYEGINNQIKNPNDQLNAIDLNGNSNTWTSDCDCYIYFYIPNNKFSWIRMYWPVSLVCCGQTFVPIPNETSDYSGFLPVPANTTVVIQIKGTQVPTFRRVPCQGNA